MLKSPDDLQAQKILTIQLAAIAVFGEGATERHVLLIADKLADSGSVKDCPTAEVFIELAIQAAQAVALGELSSFVHSLGN